MKELVEHIRTVHFTVLVLVLVMTAALHIEPNRSLERAADDAQAILQLGSHRDEVDAAISASADTALGRLQAQMNAQGTHAYWPKVDELYSVGIPYGPQPHRLQFYTSTTWVWIGAVKDKNGAWGKDRIPMGVFPVPRTLNDFLWIWDQTKDSTQGLYAIALQDATDKSPCQNLQDDSVKRPLNGEWNGGVLSFGITTSNDPDVVNIQPVVTDHHVACTFATTRGQHLDIDFSRAFGEVAPRAVFWGNGSSSEVFPELIAAAKHLEYLPLEQLAPMLQEKAEAETERIELFQAKIPVSSIPTFGGAILILCEFYLLAHLLEFRRMLKANTAAKLPSGYIGLYPNIYVFAFTLATLSFFPAVPFVYSSLQNKGFLQVWSVVACAISIALGFGCSRILLTIRRMNRSFAN